MNSIKIASGSGFWGDWLLAPLRQVEAGAIDYLVLDYLAEVTMSVLAKQLQRNPQFGFARDFVDLIEAIAPTIAESGTIVIANAGGMNPRGCAEAVRARLAAGGAAQLRIAIVEGDDLLSKVPQLRQAGETFAHFDTQGDFSAVSDSLISANAYIGCADIVSALQAGAQVVITGRVADAALALAPMVHAFGWAADDWDRLAAGTIAGHILECGAQASGGNDSYDWKSVPNLADIGYPIAEVFDDGSFEIFKHESLGGKVSRETVIQQLIYEIGDPQNYIVPDVIADFTAITVSESGPNRVRVSNARGKPRPSRLKVSCSYDAGYMAAGTMLYTWPDAAQKAYAAIEIVRERLAAAGCMPKRFYSEVIGADACFGVRAPQPSADLLEVQLRFAAHDLSKTTIERFSREIAPLVLTGPPFATAYAAGKGRVSEVYAYWPTTVAREHVTTSWEILNG